MCDSPYFTDAPAGRSRTWQQAKQADRRKRLQGRARSWCSHATETADQRLQTLVAAQLMRDIGLKVDYQAMDWGTLVERGAPARTRSTRAAGRCSSRRRPAPDMMDPLGHLGAALELRQGRGSAGPATRRSRSCATGLPWPSSSRACGESLQCRAGCARWRRASRYVPLGRVSLVRAHSAKLSGILNAAVPVYWNIKKAP